MAGRKDGATRCSICGSAPVPGDFPLQVCRGCAAMALDDAARPAQVNQDGTAGDNPVYIDGRQCWRYFQAGGGYVTLLDTQNCRDYEEFCRRNRLY